MANKKPKLTVKQAKFVAGIAAGKSGTQAALAAYDTTDEPTARSIASENLTKPNIQEAVLSSMASQGLTLEMVTKPIVDGLGAHKVNEFTGEEKPDHSVRLKASGMALKLLGADKEAPPLTINFNQYIQGQKDKYKL